MCSRGKKKKAWKAEKAEKREGLIKWYDNVIETLKRMDKDYKGKLC